MSRLDLLPQTTTRLVDAQSSRNASMTQGSPGGSGTSPEQGFDAMLEGLSEKLLEGEASAQQDGSLNGDQVGGSSPDIPSSDMNSLQALLPDTDRFATSSGATAFQSGSPAFSILEGLIPRILEQAGGGKSQDAGQSGASLAQAYLSIPQEDITEPDLMSPALGVRLPVSVQRQETHFRPVIDGLEIVPASPDMNPLAGDARDASKPLPMKTLNVIGSTNVQPDLHQTVSQVAIDAASGGLEDQAIAEQESSSRILRERNSERVDAQKQVPVGASKAEGAALPPATLHQIAGAIVEDARNLAASQIPSYQGDGLNRVAMARASAGALRVLDLQLKPAELGLVTIRMRLAGDSIEMEIQAESEETADLLKTDAEKLSNLLRMSGYRPDVITIQSTEAASHDRPSFQRPQQGAQMEGHSFQQGSTAGQGDSSRRHDERHGRDGAEVRKNPAEDQGSGGSRSGGVYL